MRKSITLDNQLGKAMIRHAENAYPNEAAGIVVASGDIQFLVAEAKDQSRCGYELAASTLINAEQGGEIVAFYHSHPDGASYLSALDARSMRLNNQPLWPGVTWFIMSVVNGRFVDMRAYIWNSDELKFSSMAVAFNE